MLRKTGQLQMSSMNPFREVDGGLADTALGVLDFLRKTAQTKAESRPKPVLKGSLDRMYSGAFKSFKRRFIVIGPSSAGSAPVAEASYPSGQLEIFDGEAQAKLEKAFRLEGASVSDIAPEKFKKQPHVCRISFADGQRLFLAFENDDMKRTWMRQLRMYYTREGSATHPMIDLSEQEVGQHSATSLSPDGPLLDDTYLDQDDLQSPSAATAVSPQSLGMSPRPGSSAPMSPRPAASAGGGTSVAAQKQAGTKKDQKDGVVTDRPRNLLSEYYAAFDRQETSVEESLAKCHEMHEATGVFVERSVSTSTAWIDQFCLPDAERRLPSSISSSVGNPNVDGETVIEIYDTRCGISLRVDHGDVLMVSSDRLDPAELSIRLQSMELRATDEVLNALSPGSDLRVPQLCVIDYKGFRVLSRTEMPFIESEGLVYGIGSLSIDDFKKRSHPRRLLKDVAERLRLAPHNLFLDAAVPTRAYFGIETQVFAGLDKKFYACRLARNAPADASYQIKSSDSVHTRVLRPELLRRYPQRLSSDAFRNVGGKAADWDAHNLEVRRASLYLHDVVIPELVVRLDDDMDTFTGAELCERMHRSGINIRYLGMIAKSTKSPHVRQLCELEICARCVKWEWRRLMREIAAVRHAEYYDTYATENDTLFGMNPVDRVHEEQISATVDLFNLVLGNSAESVSYWTEKLVGLVDRRFAYRGLNPADVHTPALFLAMQTHCGVAFVAKDSYQFWAAANPILESDFLRFQPRIKCMRHRQLFGETLVASVPEFVKQEDFSAALRAVNIDLDFTKKVHGVESLEMARTTNRVAGILHVSGSPDVAASYGRFALGVLKSIGQSFSLDVLGVYATLLMDSTAAALNRSEVVGYARRAVLFSTGVDIHPAMIPFYLAVVQSDPRNRQFRNEQLLQQAIHISEMSLGLTHPRTLSLYERMAVHLLDVAHHVQAALGYFRKAVSLRLSVRASRPGGASGAAPAAAIAAAGRPAAVQPVTFDKTDGASTVSVLAQASGSAYLDDIIIEKYAECLFLVGARGECLRTYEKCVQLREKKYGFVSQETLSSVKRLARIAEICGDVRKSVVCRENALRILKEFHRRQAAGASYHSTGAAAAQNHEADESSESDISYSESELEALTPAGNAGPSADGGSLAAAARQQLHAQLEKDRVHKSPEERQAELDALLSSIRHETTVILRMQLGLLPLDRRALVDVASGITETTPFDAGKVRAVIQDLFAADSVSEVFLQAVEHAVKDEETIEHQQRIVPLSFERLAILHGLAEDRALHVVK